MSYEYESYYCQNCKSKSTKKTCPTCNSKTKGVGKVCMRFRAVENGYLKNKRTGWYSTKKEADTEFVTYKSTHHEMQVKWENKETYDFETLLARHLNANQIETKESTQYDKIKSFQKYITPKFKEIDVRKITKKDLYLWQEWLWSQRSYKGTPLTHKYCKKIKGFFKTFLQYLNDVYDVPNQMSLVKTPNNTDTIKEKEFLELGEFKQFEKVVQDNILWDTVFCFLFHTGVRIGELQAFSESDYNSKTKTILINKTYTKKTLDGMPFKITQTKNYKAFEKPIADVLCNKLDKYIEWKRINNISSKFLFGGDVPIAEKTVSKKLDYYMNETNIGKRITPHCFRHSYVSMLVDMGCTTKTVAELIGDKEEQVIKTYAHLYSRKKEETILKLNDVLNNFCT